MAKLDKNIITTVVGVVLILSAGIAAPYTTGVTVVGGVMAAMGLKELVLK